MTADHKCCGYELAINWTIRQLRTCRRCLYRECRCCCDSITRALLDPWTTDSPHWTPRNGYTELPRLVPWDPDLLPDGNPPSGISGAMAQREGG
jgi:hypothetical protein